MDQSTGGNGGATDEVLSRLRQLMSEDMLMPGQRLPSERDLAERMQVNRRVLRKAMDVLAGEGAISRQIGRGTFVGRAAFGPRHVLVQQSATPMELLEARLGLEPVMAGEAALRARDSDVRRLRLCLKRGDEAASFDHFEEWDSAFHRSVAEGTQNIVLVMVADIFGQMRAGSEWDRLKRLSLTEERRALYRRQHREVATAIQERDPTRAARAMREHLKSIRDALSAAAAGLEG